MTKQRIHTLRDASRFRRRRLRALDPLGEIIPMPLRQRIEECERYRLIAQTRHQIRRCRKFIGITFKLNPHRRAGSLSRSASHRSIHRQDEIAAAHRQQRHAFDRELVELPLDAKRLLVSALQARGKRGGNFEIRPSGLLALLFKLPYLRGVFDQDKSSL